METKTRKPHQVYLSDAVTHDLEQEVTYSGETKSTIIRLALADYILKIKARRSLSRAAEQHIIEENE